MKTANEILNIGNELLKNSHRQGATIYKVDLFKDCKTDKEKKHLRIKLRRKLDSFISNYTMGKNNPDKVKAIQTEWHKYATQVYQDINILCDSNAKELKQEDIKGFLKAMQIK